RARHRAGPGGTAAVSVPERAGKSSGRRTTGPAGAVVIVTRFRTLSHPRRAQARAQHVAFRRPAANGRHRPRTDVEPAPPALRRTQPRARTDRGARYLRKIALDSLGRSGRRHRRAGRDAGGAGDELSLLSSRGPHIAGGSIGCAVARKIARGVFRSLTGWSGSTPSCKAFCSEGSTPCSPRGFRSFSA